MHRNGTNYIFEVKGFTTFDEALETIDILIKLLEGKEFCSLESKIQFFPFRVSFDNVRKSLIEYLQLLQNCKDCNEMFNILIGEISCLTPVFQDIKHKVVDLSVLANALIEDRVNMPLGYRLYSYVVIGDEKYENCLVFDDKTE
jgi:hypothetical protein